MKGILPDWFKRYGVDPLPPWVFKGYVKLIEKFEGNAFTKEQVVQLLEGSDLKGKIKIEAANRVSAFLFELRKRGWIDEGIDVDDARKHTYFLKMPEDKTRGSK